MRLKHKSLLRTMSETQFKEAVEKLEVRERLRQPGRSLPESNRTWIMEQESYGGISCPLAKSEANCGLSGV
jgi:hypothetical protein